MKKIIFCLFIFSFLSLIANANCTLTIKGAAKLNKPMPAEELKECHKQIQKAVGENNNVDAFRFCRGKFATKNPVLVPLTLSVSERGKVVAGFEYKKIINQSQNIEDAKTALTLSECYSEQLQKINLRNYKCSCALDYEWDGSFPLVNENANAVSFPANSSAPAAR